MSQAVPLLRVHAVLPRSLANGPGSRFVVWVQGCTLGCAGCFNPETHAAGPAQEVEPAALAGRILAEAGIEGVTLSGGEPLQQAEAVLALLQAVRPLSVLVFSGYTLAEIERQPLGPPVLAHVDVLVAGRYVEARRAGTGLLGSANQRIHLLTDRFTFADVASVPVAELAIDAAGRVTVTGVDPLRIAD